MAALPPFSLLFYLTEFENDRRHKVCMAERGRRRSALALLRPNGTAESGVRGHSHHAKATPPSAVRQGSAILNVNTTLPSAVRQGRVDPLHVHVHDQYILVLCRVFTLSNLRYRCHIYTYLMASRFSTPRGQQFHRVITDQAAPDRGMRYCRILAWIVAPPAMGPRDMTHPLDHVVVVQCLKLRCLPCTSVWAGGGFS